MAASFGIAFLLGFGFLIETIDGLSQTQSQATSYHNQYGMMATQPQKTSNVRGVPSKKSSNGEAYYYNEMAKTDKTKRNEQNLKKRMQPINVGRDRKYDDLSHNDGYLCTRDCDMYPRPRVCYYQFTVEQYAAMGPACRNCSTGNWADCKQQQCISANGIERMVWSVNRMMPGPAIYVCYGDTIVVDVTNAMPNTALTIHWHGMDQWETPWMDGVPYVAQCPIHPNQEFRYNFKASTSGTLFYHAHIGDVQREGVFGTLVVRDPRERDPHYGRYDYDLPSHVCHVSDWTYLPGTIRWPGYYRNESQFPLQPDSFLINGLGTYQDLRTRTNTPRAEFHVKCGYTYRFRIVASTTYNCAFKFAIQNHNLTVIAIDGQPCEPVVVSTLYMASGQRTDVLIDAKQACNTSYWIVVKGMNLCENTTDPQTAYLVYDNCPAVPVSTPNLATIYNKGPYYNYVEEGCVTNPNSICTDELQSTERAPARITSGNPDNRFFLSAGSTRYTFAEVYENDNYVPFYLPVGDLAGYVMDNFNGAEGILPLAPLWTQPEYLTNDMLCNGTGGCKNGQTHCRCVNILSVKLNAIVELVFLDDSSTFFDYFNHPMHIHGHHFYVLKQGSRDERNQTNYWLNTVKTSYPARRDSVMVPAFGYAVVRFRADNPGYWLFHCHFENHMSGGMFLIFRVGEPYQWPIPPKNMPKCGPYTPPVEGMDDYVACRDG